MLGRVLRGFKWPEVVLDLQFEGSAVGACGVALLVIFMYSPRVRAESASPELDSAAVVGDIYAVVLPVYFNQPA